MSDERMMQDRVTAESYLHRGRCIGGDACKECERIAALMLNRPAQATVSAALPIPPVVSSDSTNLVTKPTAPCPLAVLRECRKFVRGRHSEIPLGPQSLLDKIDALIAQTEAWEASQKEKS